MASESVVQDGISRAEIKARGSSLVTRASEFREIPIHQRNLFAVLEGMPIETAISHASCIVEGLQELAHEGVERDGISGPIAWLMSENLEAVLAILQSVGTAIQRNSQRATA